MYLHLLYLQVYLSYFIFMRPGVASMFCLEDGNLMLNILEFLNVYIT